MAENGCGYGHFTDKIKRVYYEDLDFILVNSNDCPKQKNRICEEEKCCLGENMNCKNNNCPNNKSIDRSGEP